jgi:hypothetical protein
LIRNLRLGLIPLQLFITQVKQHPYIIDNDECKPMIGETLRLLYKLDNEGLMVRERKFFISKPINIHFLIIIFLDNKKKCILSI